ncbi:calcium-translocating P-type ATPase, SERCA-type [Candidatus Woesearchaeota archaeon]|nr:calcium-translocating P-type ATPase, SERCA-type [Candidatus Woesearchaeota archaeon]
MEFFDAEKKEVISALNSSAQGLTSSEAKKRLRKYGLNAIKEERKISPIKIFINQFKSFIILILVIATIISIGLGYHDYTLKGGSILTHMTEAIAIGAILIVNAIMGFIQEYKAEKSIEALKKLTSLKAKIIRNGKEQEIDASGIVPGDIIILDTGSKIPADARLVEIASLETLEAALTGESTPVVKDLKKLKTDTAVADRTNMVFSSTIVTKGRGKAIVTATAMKTQIGKIAKLIQQEERPETPLQKDLKHFGKWLGWVTIIITVVVFIAGIITGKGYYEMFMTAIALAVAAVPEGLPAVVTITLAIGIQRLIKKKSLIRKLPSVETLGSTTVICTDKTGTITHNQMTVQRLFVNNKIVEVTGQGYDIKGKFSDSPKEFKLLLEIGALCNDADLNKNKVIGDPTEGALIVSAKKAKIDKEKLERIYPRLNELPFDSKRKLMSTAHRINKRYYLYTKGAPEELLKRCNKIKINGKTRKITKKDKKEILKANDRFARSALRILGFAYKEISNTKNLTETSLTFVGLQAMIDPPRAEAKQAIEKCHKAGIKVLLVTGDHAVTAEAIAHQVGLTGRVITGQELEKITNLEKIVDEVSIFARVSPEHKLKIVKALKKRKHVVAMTGDGVNDAPALKRADIGIAMGRTGTDVAKEASEMILTDDNFSSIVNAIEEGRNIYDNIKKFVFYLLSSNMGEILTILVAILIKLPLPLLALQILWINLVTDGLPALALSVEPAEPGIMERLPRKKGEKIINKHRTIMMLVTGIIMMIGTLIIFTNYLNKDLALAQTVSFTTLVMFQMFNVLNSRSEERSLFSLKTNYYLIAAVLSSIILQVLVVYTPLGVYFNTMPLGLSDWLWIILISSSILIYGELHKLFTKGHKKLTGAA